MQNDITIYTARIADARKSLSFYETDHPTLHSLIAAYCSDRWASHMPDDAVIPLDDAELIDLFFETKEHHASTLSETSMRLTLPPPFSSARYMLVALRTIEQVATRLLATLTEPPDLNVIRHCGRLLQAISNEAITAATLPAAPLSATSTTPHHHDPDSESGQSPPSRELVPPS